LVKELGDTDVVLGEELGDGDVVLNLLKVSANLFVKELRHCHIVRDCEVLSYSLHIVVLQ